MRTRKTITVAILALVGLVGAMPTRALTLAMAQQEHHELLTNSPFAKDRTTAETAQLLKDELLFHEDRPTAQTAKADAKQPNSTLFENVKVFDGKSDKLTASTFVLVVGNKIEKIGGDIVAPKEATVIDAGGRTLMPGLIDAHWHAMLVRPTPAEALTWDVGYANLVAGAEATDTLLRGFTAIRDVGGPTLGLKRAIDEGLVPGLRIYPSGAMITVTGGHGDFRQAFEVPRPPGSVRMEQIGGSVLADSPDEVRPPCARATHAGRHADQVDRWWWGCVSP